MKKITSKRTDNSKCDVGENKGRMVTDESNDKKS